MEKFSPHKHETDSESDESQPAPILPNLLILGFPKCGTHGLLHNLGHHPSIHSHPDEVGFFGKPGRSLAEYKALFRSDRKYNGEKSPYYVLRREAMQHIAEIAPDAKLFICIRHPIQMVHSFYNFRAFEYRHGYSPGFDPSEYSFEDIVLNDLEVKKFNIRQSCYIEHIRSNVLDFFSAQQIYFVIQERMMASMNCELNKIFSYLNLAPYETEFETKIKLHNDHFQYESINYLSARYRKALKKLAELYKPYNEELFEFLGFEIEEWNFFDRMYGELQ